jgi:hypothetical protein
MPDRINLQEKKKRREVKEWLERVKKKKIERIKELFKEIDRLNQEMEKILK